MVWQGPGVVNGLLPPGSAAEIAATFPTGLPAPAKTPHPSHIHRKVSILCRTVSIHRRNVSILCGRADYFAASSKIDTAKQAPITAEFVYARIALRFTIFRHTDFSASPPSSLQSYCTRPQSPQTKPQIIAISLHNTLQFHALLRTKRQVRYLSTQIIHAMR